jgi:hypothetical protein
VNTTLSRLGARITLLFHSSIALGNDTTIVSETVAEIDRALSDNPGLVGKGGALKHVEPEHLRKLAALANQYEYLETINHVKL